MYFCSQNIAGSMRKGSKKKTGLNSTGMSDLLLLQLTWFRPAVLACPCGGSHRSLDSEAPNVTQIDCSMQWKDTWLLQKYIR